MTSRSDVSTPFSLEFLPPVKQAGLFGIQYWPTNDRPFRVSEHGKPVDLLDETPTTESFREASAEMQWYDASAFSINRPDSDDGWLKRHESMREVVTDAQVRNTRIRIALMAMVVLAGISYASKPGAFSSHAKRTYDIDTIIPLSNAQAEERRLYPEVLHPQEAPVQKVVHDTRKQVAVLADPVKHDAPPKADSPVEADSPLDLAQARDLLKNARAMTKLRKSTVMLKRGAYTFAGFTLADNIVATSRMTLADGQITAMYGGEQKAGKMITYFPRNALTYKVVEQQGSDVVLLVFTRPILKARNIYPVSEAGLQAGEAVATCGHPGNVMDTLRAGVVDPQGTLVMAPSGHPGHQSSMDKGYEGAPLVNIHGEVVGMLIEGVPQPMSAAQLQVGKM